MEGWADCGRMGGVVDVRGGLLPEEWLGWLGREVGAVKLVVAATLNSLLADHF